MRRNAVTVVAGLALVVFVKALVGCSPAMNNGVSASVGGAPVFEVDPFWPKPLPNSWLMGQAAGVAVDKRNHVWVVQASSTGCTTWPSIRSATSIRPRWIRVSAPRNLS
jgi:hypothetical protein